MAMPSATARSPRLPNPSTSWGGVVAPSTRKPLIAVEADPAPGRLRDDALLVDPVRQVGHGVEPGGQAGEPHRGGVPGERVDQRGAAAGVAGPHPAQVAVEAAGLHQQGERELVEAGGAAVGEVLLLGQRLGERGRGEHPADPDASARATCSPCRP